MLEGHLGGPDLNGLIAPGLSAPANHISPDNLELLEDDHIRTATFRTAYDIVPWIIEINS